MKFPRYLVLSILFGLIFSVQAQAIVCTGNCVQAIGFSTNNVSDCNQSFILNITAGNAVLGFVFWDDATHTLNSATGSSDTFILLDNPTTIAGVVSAAQFYVLSSVGGYQAVHANFSGSVTTCRLSIMEIKPVTSLNGHAINPQISPGTSTDAVTSGSVASASGDFVFGASVARSGDSTVVSGTGFTDTVLAQAVGGQDLEYRTSSAGTIAATFTPGMDVQWLTGVMSFATSAIASRSHVIGGRVF